MAAMAAVVVLLLVLKTNTAVCFLALCAGSVLLSASGDNIGLVATSLTSGAGLSSNIAQILLLLVPLLVCMVVMRAQLHRAMLPISFFPAVCTALLGALFVIPLLPDNVKQAVTSGQTWSLLQQYQISIVGLGLVISLVMVALTSKKSSDKHKKGNH